MCTVTNFPFFYLFILRKHNKQTTRLCLLHIRRFNGYKYRWVLKHVLQISIIKKSQSGTQSQTQTFTLVPIEKVRISLSVQNHMHDRLLINKYIIRLQVKSELPLKQFICEPCVYLRRQFFEYYKKLKFNYYISI